MCTQYLNANALLFKTVCKNNNEVMGFSEPFDCVKLEQANQGVAIKDFVVVTYINLMESRQKRANNVLDRRDTLQVKIRLTKCTKRADEQLSLDLDEFEIITRESDDIVYDACVPYLNYKRITYVESICLDIDNPKGNYAIKVLVKTPVDEKYTVQSIQNLRVE